MGEMADYTLESIEYGMYSEDDGYDERQDISDKMCRYCGRTGLRWGLRNEKWRLFDNRGIHVCKINPLK